MKRTISIRLLTTDAQSHALTELQQTYLAACNTVVAFAVENKCTNRVALHHLSYYAVREQHACLGSQLSCNAIKAVADAYRAHFANHPKLRNEEWQIIEFANGSVHFDKRTYSIREQALSLFTMCGREHIKLRMGEFQKNFLDQGTPKEAMLARKKNRWYFNLVIDLPDVTPLSGGDVLGVDIGESNLAATSTGKLFGGKQLSHKRDMFLQLRSRLQSNGSKSAKQLLRKVSGREARHVTHVNHEVSKAIVVEAAKHGCTTIAMENLTCICKHIKAGRKVRSRLHRWAFRQLQNFIAYKAEATGIAVVYVNPAYTSQTCSACGKIGIRSKHRFSCPFCGRLAHADLNAGLNIASLGRSAECPTGEVNHRNVVHISMQL